MQCATIWAASFWSSLSFGPSPHYLDWLDLEMESNEGEHQALQILEEIMSKKNQQKLTENLNMAIGMSIE